MSNRDAETTEATEPEILDIEQRQRAKAVEIAARALTGRGGAPFGAVRPESATDVIDVADFIVTSTHPALRDHLIYGDDEPAAAGPEAGESLDVEGRA